MMPKSTERALGKLAPNILSNMKKPVNLISNLTVKRTIHKTISVGSFEELDHLKGSSRFKYKQNTDPVEYPVSDVELKKILRYV